MENNLYLNYIKCPGCKNILGLSYTTKSCPNPLCGFNFEGLEDLLYKDDYFLHKAIIKAYKCDGEREIKLLATAVRFNIANYLSHFISCNWSTHYQALYKDFIILYLNDLNALKIVLSSDTVKLDKNKAYASKNGYKMFWELYQYLMRVHSPEIRDFLRLEFPAFYRKLSIIEHEKYKQSRNINKKEGQSALI